ncbi:MAG: hydrogenase iron-sulfur subunit [Bacillota bacterium]
MAARTEETGENDFSPGGNGFAPGAAPRILVFSTNNISDPGIDLAGSNHLPYSPGALVISLPCTSGIRPAWILYAIERGFDGVFIAADGEECAYLADCTQRAARIFEQAQELLRERGYAPERVRMAAICSVCAEPFAGQMKDFARALQKIGPGEGADPAGGPGEQSERSGQGGSGGQDGSGGSGGKGGAGNGL